jgi:hypothetical protein
LREWVGVAHFSRDKPGDKPGGQTWTNLGTSMISKSQEETEVSWHLEKKALEAGIRTLS